MVKTLKIEGMKCPKCQAKAQKVLNEIDGVNATVDLDNKCATCECSDSVTDAMLTKAITDAGYEVVSVK